MDAFDVDTISRLRTVLSRRERAFPGTPAIAAAIREYDALVVASVGPSDEALRALARDAAQRRDRDLYNFTCRVFHAARRP